ncbi:hypothetical protein PFWH6_5863 [Pseudomonas fluorescens WH6]|nr:hypothetical protein PFWH6_5863 [Pseudomonas fluorescens WH6]
MEIPLSRLLRSSTRLEPGRRVTKCFMTVARHTLSPLMD